jgi:hypothetical protein
MFALLAGQLLPILYNSRYSVALLDPWLIALTAFCMVRLTGPVRWRGCVRRNRWSIAIIAPHGIAILAAVASLVTIVAMTSMTYNLARRSEYVRVDTERMRPVAAFVRIADPDRIHSTGMVQQGERQWVITESPAAFMVSLDPSEVERIGKLRPSNALWDTEIALHSTGSQPIQCRGAEVAWQTPAGAVLQPAYKLPLQLPLTADGQFRHLVTHANSELHPGVPGSLRIVLKCPIDTVVEWRETRFLKSRHVLDAAKYLKVLPEEF